MEWFLLTVFLFVTAGNWLILVRGASLIAWLGGLAGVGAALTLPYAGLQEWWWLALIVDPGTGWLLASMVFHWLVPQAGQHAART